MPIPKSTQVIIAGAGPSGLALGCLLSHYGVDFTILEKNDRTTPYSKAMVVHARSMEVFDELGLVDDFLEAGQVTERINILTNGHIAEAIRLGAFGRGLTKFPFVLTIEQSKTETILVEHLNKVSADIRWGSELLEVLTEATDEVSVTYRDANGQTESLSGAYLVGCDGARSTVRHQLGLAFEGNTDEKTFYVADVRMESSLINKKEGYMNLAAKGFVLLFGLEGDRHYRIIGVVPEEHEDRKNLTFADLRDTIKDQLKTPVDFLEEIWFSTYKVHSRMAESFVQGRCFLAGDAGHIHTPAGGQGMNTGIQDAYNLAWKLAFVLNGKSSPDILESYNQERMANAKNLLATTDREFDFMMGDQPWIGFLKLHVFPLAIKLLTTTHYGNKLGFSALAQLSISYPESSLTIPGSMGSVTAGDRMPNFNVARGVSVYNQLQAPEYKLFWFGPAAVMEQYDLSGLNGQVHIVEDAPDAFGGEGEFFAVLRPDNHIAYLGDDLEEVRRAFS
jgi:2-polyprenyl-6-methoxyphenol hydroxylase-like FAD-dependent oxidoreductase